MAVEPIPSGGLGPANWVDLDNNWRAADGNFLQDRSILRYASAPTTGQTGQVVFDQALAALRFWPGTAWHNVLSAENLKVYPGTGTEATLGHTGAGGGGLVFESTRLSSTLPFSGPSNAVTLDSTGLKIKTGASNVDALLSTNTTDLVVNRPVNALGVKTTTLTASGAVTISGALNAASLVLTGNASIAGTLGVTGIITAAGVMHADAFLQDAAQSSLAYASTRKDYVDAQVATRLTQAVADGRYVTLTGDTMTGPLTVNRPTHGPGIRFLEATNQPHFDFSNSTQSTRYAYVQADASALTLQSVGDVYFNPVGGSTIFQTNGTERGRAEDTFKWGKTNQGHSYEGVELFESGVIYSTIFDSTNPNLLLRHMSAAHADNIAFVQFVNITGGLLSSILQDDVAPVGVRFNNCTVTAPSDYRMKNDLGPVVDALDRVMQLQPKHLEWKDGGDPFDGFIAHELAGVVPNAVFGEKDAVYDEEEAARMGVEPGDIKPQEIDPKVMIPLLTAALQELTLEVRGAA